jgi:hypothetical protein
MFPGGYSDEEDDEELYGMPINFLDFNHVDFNIGDVDDLFDDEFYDTDYSDPLTDDDSDFSEGSDHSKVFKSLQDSFSVLPQIEFQLASGAMRLPRLVKAPETYETLHQVNYI